MASIKSPYIISYKQALYDEQTSELYLIMEYQNGGDLFQKIKFYRKNNKHMDEKLIWIYSIQIISGLKALHDVNILHRDFKSANIFLGRDGLTAKIGDLNVSKQAKMGLLYTQTGTPYYASPEVSKHSFLIYYHLFSSLFNHPFPFSSLHSSSLLFPHLVFFSFSFWKTSLCAR